MSSRAQAVPAPTLRRLPTYLRIVRQLSDQGCARHVSCTYIASQLAMEPTSVRKDLAATGVVGRPKVGYVVEDLIKSIEAFLGWNRPTDALLVGAGTLGRAILGCRGLAGNGLNIVAVFDGDADNIGLEIDGRQVLPLEQLHDVAAKMRLNVGVLAVPVELAASAANVMVLAGIEAIWNFAPVRLEVPDNVIVENVEIAASLAALSSKLTDRRRAAEEAGVAAC